MQKDIEALQDAPASTVSAKSAMGRALEEDGSLTPEEIELLEQRMKDLKQNFEAHVKKQQARKIDAIKSTYPEITVEEATVALMACNDDENLVLDRLAGPQAEEFWSFLRASPDTICTLSAPSIRLERTVATQESPPDATQRPRRKYNRRNSRQTSTVSKYNIMVSKMPEPQQILAGKTPEQISEERSKFNGTYTAPSADSPHLELPGTEEANDCALESSAQLRRMNDLAANASELSSSPDGRLEGFSLPLRLPTCNTVIMTLGRLHKPKDNDWWTNPAKSLYYHPYPIGFHAQKVAWEKLFDMYIEECPTTGKPLFRVGFQSSNKWYQGYTPTDPWTKWCLEQSRNGNSRASGPMFYGFSDALLQECIRALLIQTDIEEYRYRIGDCGIGESTFSIQTIKVDDFSAQEQMVLVAEISKTAGQEYPAGAFPWGKISAALPRRPGYICQLEYNRHCGSQVAGLSLPMVGVPVEEPRVPADQLTRTFGSTGTGRRRKGEINEKDNIVPQTGKRDSSHRKKRRHEMDDEREHQDQKMETSRYSAFATEAIRNSPCPDKKDAVTFADMTMPTICPCGYVCDYSTWLRVLSGGMTLDENVLFSDNRESLSPHGPKDTCPFTKQHHTRRMLVKLTNENWAEWQNRVRDV